MAAVTVIDPNSDVLLRIRGLTLRRSKIRDFDLTVRAGESVALLGPDQEELTRLIRVVGGLERPADGTVELLGVDVANATRGQLLALRRSVGYVSVAGGLLSNMTVRANVEIAMRYHRSVDPTQIATRAGALLDEVGLSALADRPASVIAAEFQKCAAYVRALACEPRFLLVEDPAAFLHPEGRVMIERLHLRLRSTRTTVLLADDDVELASRLAERAVWCEGGTISFDGSFAAFPDAVHSPSVTMRP